MDAKTELERRLVGLAPGMETEIRQVLEAYRITWAETGIALVADWLIGSILGHIPAVSLPFTYSVLLGPLVIVWYIIGELGSLAEHAVTFGAPVPSWLRNILEIGKNAVDAAGESIAGEGGGDDPKESENTKNE